MWNILRRRESSTFSEIKMHGKCERLSAFAVFVECIRNRLAVRENAYRLYVSSVDHLKYRVRNTTCETKIIRSNGNSILHGSRFRATTTRLTPKGSWQKRKISDSIVTTNKNNALTKPETVSAEEPEYPRRRTTAAGMKR